MSYRANMEYEEPEFVVPYRDTLVATQIDVINFCLTEE